MTPPRIRLLAQPPVGPVIELWRGSWRNHNISQNGALALTAEMPHDWDIWTERPLRDTDAIGRHIQFDEDHWQRNKSHHDPIT